MMFDAIEYLRARGIEMKRVGGRRWRGRCPFHQDQLASFDVILSDEPFYICHAGCVSGPLRKLPSEFNDTTSNIEVSKYPKELRVPQIAPIIYSMGLMPKYDLFRNRGIPYRIVDEAKIRWVNFSSINDINPRYAKTLMNIYRDSKGGHVYPLRHGNIIYGGIWWFPGQCPKYRTIPGTRKGSCLDYKIGKENYILLVEGIMDMLSVMAMKLPAACLHGVTLSAGQLNILRSLGRTVIYALDNVTIDRASYAQYIKMSEMLHRSGILIKRIKYPGFKYKDPNDMLMQNKILNPKEAITYVPFRIS